MVIEGQCMRPAALLVCKAAASTSSLALLAMGRWAEMRELVRDQAGPAWAICKAWGVEWLVVGEWRGPDVTGSDDAPQCSQLTYQCSRQQTAGNRQQATDSRQQTAGNRQPAEEAAAATAPAGSSTPAHLVKQRVAFCRGDDSHLGVHLCMHWGAGRGRLFRTPRSPAQRVISIGAGSMAMAARCRHGGACAGLQCASRLYQ